VYWVNSVRGDNRGVFSSGTGNTVAEVTNTSAYPAFITDGFSIPGSSITYNLSGNNYVAWGWKAGGSAVSNTDGAITSSVSANPDTGFSIVQYTGNGSLTATIGHGLGVAPQLIIYKGMTTSSWYIWTFDTGISTGFAYSTFNNSSFVTSTSTTYSPTSSNFKAGLSYQNGTIFIAYCFASVTGVSKIGSYTGNGDTTNGVTVTTGFEPSFVLFKRTNSTSNWLVLDNQRSTSNPRNDALYLDLVNTELESATYNVDFTSTGFVAKGSSGNINSNGSTYLYAAFA